jgi:hypothetical protein
MLGRQRMSFDPETVSLLRKTLDDTWERLGPEQRAATSRTLLAEGILKSAAKGERNPERLRRAALTTIRPQDFPGALRGVEEALRKRTFNEQIRPHTTLNNRGKVLQRGFSELARKGS